MIRADLYEKNAVNLGVNFEASLEKKDMPSGSTDMGNVSYEVPSIHPMFYIGTEEFNHTRGFTTASGEKCNSAACQVCIEEKRL